MKFRSGDFELAKPLNECEPRIGIETGIKVNPENLIAAIGTLRRPCDKPIEQASPGQGVCARLK